MNNCEVQNTTILVIHEIYGINNHIKDICNNLKESGFTVICPNLLGKTENFCYEDENKAYRHFVDMIGFEFAADQIITLAKELRSSSSNFYILGFSIGATIAWLCSKYNRLFDGVIGFYGSRIRDYLEVIPQCETLLFFPMKEKSFDPDIIINKLNTKNMTQIIQVEGVHGFTDQSTPYYDQASSEYCYQEMFDFILKQNHKKRNKRKLNNQS
ncbi:dienelactone hydrolase family protein [Bacillus sp. AFS041924]|uniref:dienelactone hydrolase family protein n=1 Tax=Bacillus sp. AFS041924 TaxID=2033503 RepID=UPI000BFBB378|nr:dienelactone hydrolase family protein [Bacillus sp. AFS041924]PGS48624.1 dienelactone hydrolase [Bacillus sp. AFS041924]